MSLHPRLLVLPLLGLLACREPADSGLSVGPQASGSTATTGDATTGGSTGGSEATPTTSGPADTGTTGAIDTTGSATETTAGGTNPEGETSSGDPSTTTGSDLCPEGQEGCPCGQDATCDPGLMCAADLCVPAAQCGDGVVEGDEACDEGRVNADDGPCKTDCTPQVCGDGFVGQGETCDDGNQTDGDGCEHTCKLSPPPGDACGQPGDGVWFQIDYEDAALATTPALSYSNTPNWGPEQWAPPGKSAPEVVDVFDDVSIEEDAIGTVAHLGPGAALRVDFGLSGLSYTFATACVEGRSHDGDAPVTFAVFNPKDDCGGSAMLAPDAVVQAAGMPLMSCFVSGDNSQGVQIGPTGGSEALALKRLRLTLHGATY